MPLVFASAVALATVLRWTRLGRALRLGGLGLSVGLALYGTGVVRPPELETPIGSVGSTLGAYTYVLVAVMAFLETGAFVGLVVPGETVVIVGGVVAGQGHIDLFALLGLVWACALAGDLTGYLLGHRLGRSFLLRHGPRVQITEPRLLRVEAFFARYGPATILIGRCVGLVRPLAPFLAGASRFPARRFASLAIVGTALWSTAFVMLGYVFWQSLDEAVAIAKQGTLALGGVVLLVVGLGWGCRYRRDRENRERARVWLKRLGARGPARRRFDDRDAASPEKARQGAKSPAADTG